MALALARPMDGVSALNVWTYAATSLALAAVTPARHAAQVDSVRVLRAE